MGPTIRLAIISYNLFSNQIRLAIKALGIPLAFYTMSYHVCLLLLKLLGHMQMMRCTWLHLDGSGSSPSLSTVDRLTWLLESDREDSDFGPATVR